MKPRVGLFQCLKLVSRVGPFLTLKVSGIAILFDGAFRVHGSGYWILLPPS